MQELPSHRRCDRQHPAFLPILPNPVELQFPQFPQFPQFVVQSCQPVSAHGARVLTRAHHTTKMPSSPAPMPPAMAPPIVASSPAYASAAVDATYVTTTAHPADSHTAAGRRATSAAAAARPRTP